MSIQEVNAFFDEYVYGYIFTDIERELALAKSKIELRDGDQSFSGSGNFLCALGLLCYTEFMGGISLGTFNKSSHALFNEFFFLMGADYKEFDRQLAKHPSIRHKNRKLSVYEVFRCGMTHEYFVKKKGVIFMLNGGVHTNQTIEGVEYSLKAGAPTGWYGPANQGLGVLDDGRYFFVVEQYFNDFAKACRKVHDTILNTTKTIPEW